MWFSIKRGTGETRRKEGRLNFLVRGDIQQKGKFQNFVHELGEPSLVSLFVAIPGPP